MHWLFLIDRKWLFLFDSTWLIQPDANTLYVSNTELTLLNNKNWLLPSPDREFQKSVAETSPFRPQQKKKKPTKPVNSSFVSIFPLFKLIFWFDFSCFFIVIAFQNRIILVRFCIILMWF